MKRILTVVAAAVLLSVAARAQAQQVRPFAGVGTSNEGSETQIFTVSGGALFELPKLSWLAAGGQADLFIYFPYLAGRGTVLVQADAVKRRGIRLFGLGGYGMGEIGGPMIGGGVEFSPGGRIGFRATVQDYLQHVQAIECGAGSVYSQYECNTYLNGGRAWTSHQPSLTFGITWK